MSPRRALPSLATLARLVVFLLVAGAARGAMAADAAADALRRAVTALSAEDWPAARAVLEEATAARPADCTLRAFMAWLEIESGRGEPGLALVAQDGCPGEPEDRARWPLLRALAAERAGDAAGVRLALGAVGERQPLWPEDEALARSLALRRKDGFTLPLEAHAELGLGGTSNAFALSPTDAARREAPGSGVARPSVRLRLRAPEGRVTPLVELGARGYALGAEEARELSQAELQAAAGARLGRGSASPTLRYRHEDLFLEAVSGTRYWTADRGEVEFSPTPSSTVFGGGGRRVFFTDAWRTRTEWDLAALQAVRVLGRPLVLGAAFRLYAAERDVHDQVGGTLSAATELPLRASLRARLALSGAYDDFPRSGGVDGLVAFGTTDRRRDGTLRLSAALWRPLGRHAALGLGYEYARRWSTADAVGIRYYPYTDHRLLVTLRAGLATNPWRAPARDVPGRVALPWRDLEEWSVLRDDPVRQMLRREEDLGADCGCVVP